MTFDLRLLNSEALNLKPFNSEAIIPFNIEALNLKPLNSEGIIPFNSEAIKPLNN